MKGYMCVQRNETGICSLDCIVNMNEDKAEERKIELYEETGFECDLLTVEVVY
jgi:hypothetical protein